MHQLRTERLVLRQWRADDRAPFAALNSDPEVMRHFPAPLTRAASDAIAERASARLEEQGWGLWAVEVPGVAPFIGFIGMMQLSFPAAFTPAIEVGWRLDRPYWGRGYAVEGATAVLGLAFAPGVLGLSSVVSLTAVGNHNSRRVMEKLGMTHDPAEDFDHPYVPEGSPVRRHVVYRMTAKAWQERR